MHWRKEEEKDKGSLKRIFMGVVKVMQRVGVIKVDPKDRVIWRQGNPLWRPQSE